MAEGFKFSPRCNATDPCCVNTPPCDWFDDDFERAASTALGDKWEEVVGDWEIDASGRLVIDTSDARARPRWNNGGGWTNFGNLSEFYLRAVVSATAADDEILFGVPHSTAGEIYTFGLRVGVTAKIWFGSSDLATVKYECNVTAATNTEHEIIFDCGVIYLNGTAVANVIGLLDRVNIDQEFFVGTKDVTGEVRIHELVIEKTRVSHPASTCPTCPICPLFLGDSPANATIVIAGHTGRWATLNGTYSLARIQDYGRTSEDPCLYEITDLGKTFDVNGDGSVIADITTLTMLTGLGGVPSVYFTGPDLMNVQYNYAPATLPCAGADAVLDYSSTGYGGLNADPLNTQAGSTATIDL